MDRSERAEGPYSVSDAYCAYILILGIGHSNICFESGILHSLTCIMSFSCTRDYAKEMGSDQICKVRLRS
jgi:hypothetical protein